MRPRRVVDHVLDAGDELADFVGEALHDVLDENPKEFLDFFVLVLDKPLFHGSPRDSELLDRGAEFPPAP